MQLTYLNAAYPMCTERPLMKYAFFPSLDEINGIFSPEFWIFFLSYEILSMADFLHYIIYDIIHDRTLCHIA